MFSQNIENCLKLLVRRSPFADVLRNQFRQKPHNEALLYGDKHGWGSAASWVLFEEGKSILSNNAFHDKYRHEINDDIRTEFLLTAMRKCLLLSDLSGNLNCDFLEIIVTLVKQAHNNEFVWQVSEEERKRLSYLTRNILKFQNTHHQWLYPVLLLMYGRPGQVGHLTFDQHAELLEGAGKFPAELDVIIESCIVDYKKEKLLKQGIKKFGEITSETSKIISQNYETYPYPRWLSWEFPEPGSRIQKLSRFFSNDELAFTEKPFNVLVAGCGTGSKAIEYAIGYGNNVNVLAIDLSASSLAYAKRMAIKHGVNNIEFIQMDLLQLPLLQREFEIVECTGVLHHMADPVEGGRAIISRVVDGGLVHISLYSELARRSIVNLRNRYCSVPDMSDDQMRDIRVEIMQNDADIINEELSLRWDFFDLNRCKDLIFHPLEHRYTIPLIGLFIDELNLEFHGIEKPDIVRNQYWTHYPDEKEMANLNKWNEFELRHPDVFGNLYEIWAKNIS